MVILLRKVVEQGWQNMCVEGNVSTILYQWGVTDHFPSGETQKLTPEGSVTLGSRPQMVFESIVSCK